MPWLIGSEGTLAYSERLLLKLSPLPKHKTLGIVHFPSFYRSMEAPQHIVKLGPAAVELVDRTMIGLARGNPALARATQRKIKVIARVSETKVVDAARQRGWAETLLRADWSSVPCMAGSSSMSEPNVPPGAGYSGPALRIRAGRKSRSTRLWQQGRNAVRASREKFNRKSDCTAKQAIHPACAKARPIFPLRHHCGPRRRRKRRLDARRPAVRDGPAFN